MLEPEARTYYQRYKAYLKLRRFSQAVSDLDAALALDDTMLVVRPFARVSVVHAVPVVAHPG